MPDAPVPALAIEGLRKSFGGLVVTNGANLSIATGELHALIGPNGAGKTTLLSLIGGELIPDAGKILIDGVDVTGRPPEHRAAAGLARSFQISQLYNDFSALDNVIMALQARRPGRFNMWKPARGDPEVREAAMALLERVGLESKPGIRVSELAHGDKRQLELAMALALDARVLLLDEPMAGMGGEESRRMTTLLQSLKGQFSILLVEHDMDAVFALADKVTVLVYGVPIFTGTPAEVRSNADVQAAYLGPEHAC